jgi:hypothetical protein
MGRLSGAFGAKGHKFDSCIVRSRNQGLVGYPTGKPFFFSRTISRAQILAPQGLVRIRLHAIFFRTLPRTAVGPLL